MKTDTDTERLPAWIAQIASAKTTVEIRSMGFPLTFTPHGEWDTGERVIEEHLLYCIVAGSCRAVVDGQAIRLGAGDFCWVSPGTKFRFQRGEDDLTLQRFRLYVGRGRTPLRGPFHYLIVPSSAAILHEAAGLARERDPEGRYSAARLRARAVLFFCAVFEQWERPEPAQGLPTVKKEKVLNLALSQLHRRLTARDLAREAGLAPEYFTRLFRASFGMSPRVWLVQQRLKQAGTMLREYEELPISEIAERMGYADGYLFSRQFKAFFGVSPRRWRSGPRRTRPEFGQPRSEKSQESRHSMEGRDSSKRMGSQT